MGHHVVFGILGFLRLLHDKFKFTPFDSLLQQRAEEDPNYGLSNVLDADLFALLYTAVYTMYLCDNTGVIITKEKFVPLLKNSSLYMVRNFRSLCNRELAKFSVRASSGLRGGSAPSMTMANARKLKNYFSMLHHAYLFISKPIGHPIHDDTFTDDDLSMRNLVDENQQEVSNFARRLVQNQRSVASTPSSVNTQRSEDATQ